MQKLPSNWNTELERQRTSESGQWALYVQQGPDRSARTARLAEVPTSLRTPVMLALVSTYRVKLLALRPRGMWASHSEAVFAEIPVEVQPLVREAIEREKQRRQKPKPATS